MSAVQGEAFAGLDAAALLAALPDPVALLRPDGTVTLNAAAHERIARVSPGGDWNALFDDASVQAVRGAAQQALAGQSAQVTARLLDTVAPALVTAAPAGGGALLHLHAARDPLEVALELMDSLRLGMAVQAPDGRILHANRAAEAILGLSQDQLRGRASVDPRWQAIHPDGSPFPGEQHPAMQALATGEPQHHVPMGIFHPHSESWRWLDVSAIPRLAPGRTQPKQVTAVFTDVTELRAAQSALGRSEQRFRSLVQATAQVVWTARPDGAFMPPQPDWEAFTGQTPEQYSPDGWVLALHPEDRAHAQAAWQRATREHTGYRTEYRVRRADGQYVAMEARGVPVRGEQGEILEWVGTNTDVTELHAARQSLLDANAALEARVQARTAELAEVTRFSTLLLTAAGEGIFGLDAAGVTTFANPAAARMLGYSVEHMIGQKQHALVHHHHEDGRPYLLAECPIHQTLVDGVARRRERDVMWHASGRAVPVGYVVTPTHTAGGEVSGAVVMVQDITEREQARAQLHEMIENLERSNQDLEQFAYVASHDLQEPLRTIGSYTELLARRYAGQLDDRAGQYLQFTQAAVERMRSLIQDLLTFARTGRQDAPPVPVALNDLMQATAANLQGSLQGGGTLSWDTPHRVLGQGSLLTQLLTNLVGNGLKFHAPGEAPRVHVSSAQAGAFVHLQVRDHGIGIAPDHHARVFEIFQRLHHRDTFAGNGMGLAICRKIAEHHGGRIWVESVPGQGSTFHVLLPGGPTP
ncbi:PAS domain-containing sensor histidine kinase [Deinococcus arcticus]|uniref:histidine kinase n=1 Tax=Deinococcus arcticus TaxID=2136176 RepID=A0A2T3WA41_9DEIO|nr:PAS domain S-box protein [Deinococcus arcticus]PTA68664.1 PAS domain-containing sensor histidine kinase [Deinococcus arcticus]